jgi:DNA repair protein RecN (Recombination protein N)
LPQVAAQGKSHYCVQKEVQGGRTATRLTVLEGKSRAQEIARMLGGQSDQSLALAKALLEEK